jgi:hypothetical protein
MDEKQLDPTVLTKSFIRRLDSAAQAATNRPLHMNNLIYNANGVR